MEKGPLLKNGESLREGDYLVSNNKRFCACLHVDGNLCLYASPSPDAETNYWCSGKIVSAGDKCAYLHPDGNLCIYDNCVPDANKNIWCSGATSKKENGSSCVYLHDNGNLCIYSSESPNQETNIWCSSQEVLPIQKTSIKDIIKLFQNVLANRLAYENLVKYSNLLVEDKKKRKLYRIGKNC